MIMVRSASVLCIPCWVTCIAICCFSNKHAEPQNLVNSELNNKPVADPGGGVWVGTHVFFNTINAYWEI